MKTQIFAILVAFLLTGCAAGLTITGSAVPTGEPRPAAPEELVERYQAAPENAVILGTVQVVSSQNMNDNLDVIALIYAELIKQAATIGANGIVTKPIVIDKETGAETRTADAIYAPKQKAGSNLGP